ncbi:hypothetical protein CI109_103995 [Kwoniella shandongensis]|uniref:Uncharacterized protein n=1 Tax=Kwoniella shandongensis TaxID=1734106 RepID=A0A5M6BYW6_9TREE|nr:uncharacterized protein CI109_004120 [Kwoniella shandongensis]KAA5527581.1 hypothetical protein CI109_004120 [Kwoniella shandongensis]
MACSTLASSSRTLPRSTFTLSPLGSTRGVLHRARPPRIPILPSPHTPKTPLPTSGTSHPIDPKVHTNGQLPPSTTSSTSLEDSDGLTFHHSPPPSLPSYTNGQVPSLLKWLGGESVRLTGEEGAPVIKERKVFGGRAEWSEEVVSRIKELRAQGLSRKAIGETLQIPAELHRLIPRIAPQTPIQSAEKASELEAQKSTWGYKKRLSREVKQKRKEFW